jgi:hypothetical protein
MRKRFQDILVEELSGPYATPTDADVARIVDRFDTADVEDLLDELAVLSAERETVEEWDGDTYDDIASAQSFITRMLAAMPDHREALVARLAAADPVTSAYLRLALGLV